MMNMYDCNEVEHNKDRKEQYQRNAERRWMQYLVLCIQVSIIQCLSTTAPETARNLTTCQKRPHIIHLRRPGPDAA